MSPDRTSAATSKPVPAPVTSASGRPPKPDSSAVRQVFAELLPKSPEKRPNKRGQQTRQKLIEAAAACFSEYGYSRTRVTDIVLRAGTAQGNFYRHFSGLDEAFLAALQPALEELSTAWAEPVTGEDEEQQLIKHHFHYLQLYARNRHLLRVMREAAAVSDNEGFRRLWLQLRGAFVDSTERWLRSRYERGGVAKVDFALLAEALGSLIEQVCYVQIGLQPVTPRPERIQELAAVIGQVWYRSLPPLQS